MSQKSIRAQIRAIQGEIDSQQGDTHLLQKALAIKKYELIRRKRQDTQQHEIGILKAALRGKPLWEIARDQRSTVNLVVSQITHAAKTAYPAPFPHKRLKSETTLAWLLKNKDTILEGLEKIPSQTPKMA